jgi:hypothetical protein
MGHKHKQFLALNIRLSGRTESFNNVPRLDYEICTDASSLRLVS